MARYEIYLSENKWRTGKSKDDIIQLLMGYINGDGVNHIKVVYPDKSYYEYEGEDNESN